MRVINSIEIPLLVVNNTPVNDLFVPYSGKSPAYVHINGHKLLILSTSRSVIDQNLQMVGADRVKRLKGGSTLEDQERALIRLAKRVEGGIVVAPSDLEIKDIIRDLESQLPWVH